MRATVTRMWTITRDRLLPARRREPSTGRREIVLRALLACGIAYGPAYIVVNDVIAAGLHDGYDRTSQAVSELSAAGAPTRALLVSVLPVFSLMQIGFGLGILQSARHRRSLRIAGGIVVAHGAVSFLWLFAPMSQRAVIAAGGATPADTMHLVLAGATGVFVAASVATAAVAFGWVFRVYSLVTIAAALVFGILSGQVDKVAAGEPTPSMGLLERISIGTWLLWMTVLAIVLLRERSAWSARIPRSPGADQGVRGGRAGL